MLNPDHITGSINLSSKGFDINSSCFLKLENIDIEFAWKILEEEGKTEASCRKIVNYEMYRIYKSVENNKFLYTQKLEKFSDPFKNWEDFYDQIKTLCSACMSKNFIEPKSSLRKILKNESDRPEYSTSMTFVTLATL